LFQLVALLFELLRSTLVLFGLNLQRAQSSRMSVDARL
jgi:hypothetical protein